VSILSSRENNSIFLSPFCISILEKSIEFLFTLAGVPVLNLKSLIFNFSRTLDSLFAGKTPSGPPSNEFSPIKIFPLKYVPVHKIISFTLYTAPTLVSILVILLFSTPISTISACFRYKFGCLSRVCFISI